MARSSDCLYALNSNAPNGRDETTPQKSSVPASQGGRRVFRTMSRLAVSDLISQFRWTLARSGDAKQKAPTEASVIGRFWHGPATTINAPESGRTPTRGVSWTLPEKPGSAWTRPFVQGAERSEEDPRSSGCCRNIGKPRGDRSEKPRTAGAFSLPPAPLVLICRIAPAAI